MPDTAARVEYDVFLSYSRRDAAAVGRIATLLAERDVRVWFDEWTLQPGQPWQERIEEGLEAARCVAVFVGASGLGPWEVPEMRAALDFQARDRQKSVLPVLLPGALERNGEALKVTQVLPPFLARFTAIAFTGDLDDEQVLGRLYWGITGRNPLAARGGPSGPRVAPLPVVDPDAAAVAEVAEAVIAGDTTFLLGRTAAGARNPHLPAPAELSARLLKDLSLVGDAYQGLVPGIECVAALLAATKGPLALESRVLDILADAGDARPEVHTALARLMKVLGQRPTERRARRRAPRLILSTGYDLLMERALLRMGLPFTRLVQFRSEPRIDVTEFKDVKRVGGDIIIDGRLVSAEDADAIDAEIDRRERRSVRLVAQDGAGGSNLAALPIEQYTDPILYKFQGSQDIKNSCAISADQCFDFAWRLLKQECVPNKITEIIGSSTLVTLGTSVLDHDFRLLYHTLLRSALEGNTSNPRYAVLSRSDTDDRDATLTMSGREWPALESSALSNYRIKSVDASPADFLKCLATVLSQRWGLPA